MEQPTGESITAKSINIDEFAKVTLLIGRIISAEGIPKSKKLLKLRVDLGPTLGERQVLAGIAKSYLPEALIDHRVIVVANLQKATIAGEESEGMLLAGSYVDNEVETIKLITPPAELPLGSSVR
jgi:methionyl-tRNA synthetase